MSPTAIEFLAPAFGARFTGVKLPHHFATTSLSDFSVEKYHVVITIAIEIRNLMNGIRCAC